MAFKDGIVTTVERARELDAKDPLAKFRSKFVIGDPNIIYLDGNSLGRMPKSTSARVKESLDFEWGSKLVQGWNQGWFHLSQRIGAKIAKLVGAHEDEIIVCDSTSINLFKLALAAVQVRSPRSRIVSDELNFPSDLYILQSVAKLSGNAKLELVRSSDKITVDYQTLSELIDSDTALVELTHTTFKSGFVYDMNVVTELAHSRGALMLWDLCHSVGAMPINLNECNVDLAVGCTYKYLNGGPGSPAFIYVRRDLQEVLTNPIWGWFGQQDQFSFDLDYSPAKGITRFLVGTPPVLSILAIEPGVDILLEAGIEKLREKSMQQTEFLIELWGEYLRPIGVELNSPRDPHRRGSHVSLGHPEGWRINRALIEEMNVIPDFRAPDNIRLGLAPIYTTFREIQEGILRFRRVLEERIYERYPVEKLAVT